MIMFVQRNSDRHWYHGMFVVCMFARLLTDEQSTLFKATTIGWVQLASCLAGVSAICIMMDDIMLTFHRA